MKTNGIHHIAIICSDYERSKHFYTRILGFKIIQETCRKERKSYKLDLEVAGKYQIELFSFPDPPQRLTLPEACGLRHLAFEVDNIDEVVRDLRALGVDSSEVLVDEVTGKRFAFFHDPDDLPLEIYAR
ncbi:MAG: VOC family protein [Chloroflexi bacterium]|nr:VOC family protein [Chloroflexota bacterium]